MRARGRTAVVCAVAGILAAGGGQRSGADDPPPIRFEELSTLSGGPYDLGAPKSDVEKATCAFFDADGDGWEDFLSLTGTGQADIFLLNRPDGMGGRRFEPAPPGHGFDSGPAFERDGAGLAIADVDNDGDEDVFVGAGWNESIGAGNGGKMLMLNDGSGRFTDVAPALGIVDGDNSCMSAVFFDMDMDGDLDLLACNTRFPQAMKEGDGVTHLWRNSLAETGELGFVDEAALRGITEDGTSVWAVLAFDKDGDGDPDLVISHDIIGRTQLFENDGSGWFEEMSARAGTGAGDDQSPSNFGNDSYNAMGIAAGDPDHDGDVDIYITNTNSRNPFYVNDGSGRFTQLGTSRGVAAAHVTWGCTFTDFDLDGWEDLYVAGGDFWNGARPEVVDFLYRNLGYATFTDVKDGSGLRHDPPLHRKNGTAVADWDGDGRPDLLVSRCERAGASPYLYRNVSPAAGRRWLSVLAEGNGRTSNRSAIGAVVRVTPLDAHGDPVPGLAQMQEVYSAESRGSRSSLRRHFGLGEEAVAADIAVTWPRAGTLEERTLSFRGIPLDRRITIGEDPREDTWFIDPEADAVVPDGRESPVLVAGAGTPDPLTRVVIDQGPEWVSTGEFTTGWTLAVSAPRVDSPAEFPVIVRAEPQGTLSPEGTQALRIRVVPAPRIDSIRRRGSPSRLRMSGIHLEMDGLAVTVGGIPCRVERVRLRREPDGSITTRMDVVVPKEARRAFPGGERVLVVEDPATGFRSSAAF